MRLAVFLMAVAVARLQACGYLAAHKVYTHFVVYVDDGVLVKRGPGAAATVAWAGLGAAGTASSVEYQPPLDAANPARPVPSAVSVLGQDTQ